MKRLLFLISIVMLSQSCLMQAAAAAAQVDPAEDQERKDPVVLAALEADNAAFEAQMVQYRAEEEAFIRDYCARCSVFDYSRAVLGTAAAEHAAKAARDRESRLALAKIK